VRDVADALGVTPEVIHELATKIAKAAAPLEATGLPSGIEGHRLFRLLAERSKITVNRTEVNRWS